MKKLIILILVFSIVAVSLIVVSLPRMIPHTETGWQAGITYLHENHEPVTGIVVWRDSFNDNEVIKKVQYKDGLRHGKSIEYWPLTGKTMVKGTFRNGEKDGLWYWYNYEGDHVLVTKLYDKGVLLKKKD